MPELPEVETIRRQLSKKIVGKKLEKGPEVKKVWRRAKLLIISLSDKTSLVFHLKMTGQLIFQGEPSKYTQKIFKFKDGSQLLFNSVRKFSWWKRLDKEELKEELADYGPEPLSRQFTFKKFQEIVKKYPRSQIKSLLMKQDRLAGIGNIYSDESLFEAGIQPTRKAKSLKQEEIKKLYQAIKKILKKALKYHGTSRQYYRDALGEEGVFQNNLKVYQQETCPQGHKIKKEKVGGRSAHYCPKCQK